MNAISDQDLALHMAKITLGLLKEALKSGIDLTPELGAEMSLKAFLIVSEEIYQ